MSTAAGLGRSLAGRTVLVTGGNGGIGLGMAAAMGAAGATIVIWGRDSVKNETALQRLAANRKIDLLATIPHGTGQTYLREILLIADHNAYHIGQIVALRRLLGIWG